MITGALQARGNRIVFQAQITESLEAPGRRRPVRVNLMVVDVLAAQ